MRVLIPPAGNHNTLSLFVFIDALGWRLFNQHSLLQDELQVSSPLGTILGYSCACDPTILTGRMPQQHGHFSFFRYSPQQSPFGWMKWLRWLPLTNRGRVRRQLSRFVAWWHGYTGYFQLYNVPLSQLPLLDYSEKRDLYQPGGILSGDKTVFDHLREDGTPFLVSDWRRTERENLAEMTAAVRRRDIQFGYLYLAKLDAVLHREGTRSEAVSSHIDWYDTQLRRLLRTARCHYDDVRMFVFSDHGMTDVRRTLDLMACVQRTGLKFGVDYAAIYDSTMARFWFLHARAEQQIRQLLDQLQDCGRVLDDQQLQDYGCQFADRAYGELFFLLDPGVLLCPSHMGARPLKGMHGYAPEHEDSTALFASTAQLAGPRRLDGMAELMLSEARHNGGRERTPELELAGGRRP